MLKVCFDCICGTNESQNEQATTMNGYGPGSMSNKRDEMTFRLPRPLQNDDIIEIVGQMKPNAEKICIGLATGQYNVDYNNMVTEIQADFIKNIMMLKKVVNGSEDIKILGEDSPSDILPDANFIFSFKCIQDYNAEGIQINVDEHSLGVFDLEHRCEEITYIVCRQDILKVTELRFKFNYE